jgi:hypothetical protein
VGIETRAYLQKRADSRPEVAHKAPMANDKRKQKKAEQKRKKRDLVKKEHRKQQIVRSSPRLMLQGLTDRSPFGPTFVSSALDSEEGMPSLVQVLVSRQIAGAGLVFGLFLVDRTCLGVKSGFLLEAERIEGFLAAMEERGDPMKLVEPLVAQSVLFHGLDYAARLGFKPDPQAPLALIGPRPETLIATPLANLPRPFYVDGPDDKPEAVIAQLTKVCGAGNFDAISGRALGGLFNGLPGLLGELEQELDGDDEDGDEEGDDDVIEAEGTETG